MAAPAGGCSRLWAANARVGGVASPSVSFGGWQLLVEVRGAAWHRCWRPTADVQQMAAAAAGSWPPPPAATPRCGRLFFAAAVRCWGLFPPSPVWPPSATGCSRRVDCVRSLSLARGRHTPSAVTVASYWRCQRPAAVWHGRDPRRRLWRRTTAFVGWGVTLGVADDSKRPLATAGRRRLTVSGVGGGVPLAAFFAIGRRPALIAAAGCLAGGLRSARASAARCCWHWLGSGAFRQLWRLAADGVGAGVVLGVAAGGWRLLSGVWEALAAGAGDGRLLALAASWRLSCASAVGSCCG